MTIKFKSSCLMLLGCNISGLEVCCTVLIKKMHKILASDEKWINKKGTKCCTVH